MSAETTDGFEGIFTTGAPAPIGPYRQGVRAGNLLFCSGQTPIDPATGKVVDGDVSVQARRVLDNLAAVLEAAGCTFAQVAKTTIFLIDMNDFAAVNAVYKERIGESAPARSTVAVAALPMGARVEIEVIAVLA